MGDAAFLLIAKEPATGLLIIAISFIVGALTGLITDLIHGPDFMRPKYEEKIKGVQSTKVLTGNRGLSIKLIDRFWISRGCPEDLPRRPQEHPRRFESSGGS